MKYDSKTFNFQSNCSLSESAIKLILKSGKLNGSMLQRKEADTFTFALSVPYIFTYMTEWSKLL